MRWLCKMDYWNRMVRLIYLAMLPLVVSVAHANNDSGRFGKAYVVTMKPTVPKESKSTAYDCGFTPQIVPAVQPYSQIYKGKEDMIEKVFHGLPRQVLQKLFNISISLKEIGLIASHRNAFDLIASDNSTVDSDWSLILEEDARLVPELVGRRAKVSDIISKSISAANALNQNFIYFGMCGGFCHGMSSDRVVGTQCVGSCTHAYAITKRGSITLFQDIYNNDKVGQQQIDQAFKNYRLNTIPPVSNQFALLVGPNITSPDDKGHYGILYQCCRNLNVKTAGTSLDGFDRNYLLDLVQYQTSFTGRLGNLMFEYAAIAGLCIKKGFAADMCVSHSVTSNMTANFNDLPTKEFFETFKIPQPQFNGVNSSLGNSFREHKAEPYDIKFDPQFFEQPPGTIMSGYFQSFKYFHPHATDFIRERYKFPKHIREKANRFFNDIKKSSLPRNHIVCMAIRRGDKTTTSASNTYRKWALSTDYYFRAIEYFRTRFSGRVTLIVFTGGAFSQDIFNADREWVKSTMSDWLFTVSPSNTEIYYDDNIAHDHLASMYAMTQCPNIIVASSSYSWWAAFLSGHSNVIAPKYLHEGLGFVPADYYPSDWILLDEDDIPPVKVYPVFFSVIGVSFLFLVVYKIIIIANSKRVNKRQT